MKNLPAVIAAVLVTACIGLGMFAVGANALLNPDGVAVASSPADTGAADTSSGVPADKTQIQQMQSLIAQYQQREQQYQKELDQARQQVSQTSQQVEQASQQLQQYQNLLEALQESGVIQVTRDGQVLVREQSGDDDN